MVRAPRLSDNLLDANRKAKYHKSMVTSFNAYMYKRAIYKRDLRVVVVVVYISILARRLLLPLLGYEAELVVPRLSETADERFFKKLIDRQMEFLAQYASTVAYIPSMVFHANHVAYLVEANRVEVARDGFLKVDLARVICFLDKAIAPAIVVGAGKDTVFVVDDRGDFLARWVEVRQTLCLHHRACFFGHIGQ